MQKRAVSMAPALSEMVEAVLCYKNTDLIRLAWSVEETLVRSSQRQLPFEGWTIQLAIEEAVAEASAIMSRSSGSAHSYWKVRTEKLDCLFLIVLPFEVQALLALTSIGEKEGHLLLFAAWYPSSLRQLLISCWKAADTQMASARAVSSFHSSHHFHLLRQG